MKKIITLLMLSALFFVPKRVQADVTWEVSDGTQWRINPANPANPNDSILIPAGTKFVRVMCGYDKSDGQPIVVVQNSLTFESNGNNCDYYYYFRYARLNGSITSQNWSSSDFNINFPDDALRVRLQERILGYNYLRITYGSSLSDKLASSLPLATRLTNVRYLYKIVLTEEEALGIKKLNFDPKEYGISNTKYIGVRNIIGLEIFQNLEELILANNLAFGTITNGSYISQLKAHGDFIPDFNTFSKLKILDLSDIPNPAQSYTYLYEGTPGEHFSGGYMPKLPSSLEYLFVRNSTVVNTIELDGTSNPNLKVIDATNNGTLRTLVAKDCPQLESVLVTNCPRLRVLNCSKANLQELDLTACPKLEQLYCNDNMLETLIFDKHSYLYRVECQENNLTSLNVFEKFGTPQYIDKWRPSQDFYYTITGDRGEAYIYRASESENLHKWTYLNFEFSEIPRWHYDPDDDYEWPEWDWEFTDKLNEVGISGYCYPDQYDEVTNPDIPVQYTKYSELQNPQSTSLRYLDCSKNNITNLQLLWADKLEELYCWNNKLTDLNLSPSTQLWRLRMSNNKVTSLDVTNNTKITDFYCNSNGMNTITGFASLTGLKYFMGNNNNLTELDCSEMKQLRDFQVSRNKLRELVFSNNPYLHTVICDAQGGKTVDGRLLSILKLDGCPSLDSLVCNDNAILSLNLTASTKLTPAKMKAYTQRSVQDIVVLDRNKVCIELPNGVMKPDGQAAQFQTWATGGSSSGFNASQSRTITRNGMTYLVLYDISEDAIGDAQTKADVDFYGAKKRYHYTIWDDNLNETLGKSVAKNYANDNVTVTVYPYVMYINPLTHDVYTDSVNQENQFYSGTIYLDYDAVVPEGTEVYIAQGLHTVFDTDLHPGRRCYWKGRKNAQP